MWEGSTEQELVEWMPNYQTIWSGMPYPFVAIFQSCKVTLQGLQALLATLASSNEEGEAASSFILSGHSMVSFKPTHCLTGLYYATTYGGMKSIQCAS